MMLDENRRLLLHAAFGEGEQAVRAYKTWRSRVPLDAISFEHKADGGSVDLHWWPLPRWTHHQFVEELFERSEVGSLAGHFVRIPALADHLYLTLARPEAWEADEVFARAAEAIHIL